MQSCLHAGNGPIVAAVPVARVAAKLRAAQYIAQSLPDELTKGAGGGFCSCFFFAKGDFMCALPKFTLLLGSVDTVDCIKRVVYR